MTTPTTLANDTIQKLTKVLSLDGFFQLNLYLENRFTIRSIAMPSGLCCCEQFSNIYNDYEIIDYDFHEFSLETQRTILLELADHISI